MGEAARFDIFALCTLYGSFCSIHSVLINLIIIILNTQTLSALMESVVEGVTEALLVEA